MQPLARVEALFHPRDLALLVFSLLVLFLVPNAAARAAPTELVALSSEAASGLRPRKHSIKPAHSTIPPGFDRLRIGVKFQDGLEPDLDDTGKPGRTSQSWTRIIASS